MNTRRKHSTPRIFEVRPLVESDLETLHQPRAESRLLRIRDSHHMICRLMASGLKLGEIASRTGFSVTRLSILSRDPSIVELVAHYRNIITEDWRQEVDSIIDDGLASTRMAQRMIRDQLEEADEVGEKLPLKTLVAVASDNMDRFGYGKKTHNTNLNIDFAANLEAAIARSKKVSAA
jgi:hypothetical protein